MSRAMEIGERLIPLEAVFNFRDLGDYETLDGHRVRRGLVYRSGPLQRLTAADLERTRELGVRTVIDLRSTAELTEWGRFPPAADVTFHHLPLYEDRPSEQPEGSAGAPDDDDEREVALGAHYAEMAQAGRDALAAAVRVIARGDEVVVFHCGSGKDRTGILAALLLATLGMADESIGADYELSELALAPSIAWAEANDPAMAAALADLPPWKQRSAPQTMRVFLEHLRAEHGSIGGFLTDAGVEPEVLEALRRRLLEP